MFFFLSRDDVAWNLHWKFTLVRWNNMEASQAFARICVQEKSMATRLFFDSLTTSQMFKAIPKTYERSGQYSVQQYVHFALTALYSTEMAESTQREDLTLKRNAMRKRAL